MEIREELYKLQDTEYGDFQSKLTPGIPRERFIGVRMPELRKLAKAYAKEKEAAAFLKELPHFYYEENLLHGLLIAGIKDFRTCMEAIEAFLPYVDNWAVCDGISPKVFAKPKQELLAKIKEWSSSKHVYTCRFGIGMLMRHFLEGDFLPEYLEIPADVCSEEYYVNMMLAWFFATALAKQWESTIPYLEQHRLGVWVHNKTIQKAVESFRITKEQKAYLRTLKRQR